MSNFDSGEALLILAFTGMLLVARTLYVEEEESHCPSNRQEFPSATFSISRCIAIHCKGRTCVHIHISMLNLSLK